MSTYQSDLAYPRVVTYQNGEVCSEDGLTKREHFAAMAMQGIHSSGLVDGCQIDGVSELAVEAADSLIKALNEAQK